MKFKSFEVLVFSAINSYKATIRKVREKKKMNILIW